MNYQDEDRSAGNAHVLFAAILAACVGFFMLIGPAPEPELAANPAAAAKTPV